MKQYILKRKDKSENLGIFDSKKDAADKMYSVIINGNMDLTPFDFEVKEVDEVDDPSVAILDFKTACGYLNIRDYVMIRGCKKHMMAAEAFYKLSVIAEAWNKMDGFVLDFGNPNQYKYFPGFLYDKTSARFMYAYSLVSTSMTNANIGSRLCLKTRDRAKQFGEQFVDLYNQMFL